MRIFHGSLLLTGAMLIAVTPSDAAQRTLLVATFDAITVDGDLQIDIVTGRSPSASVTGDQRLIDSLKLERFGTTLRVRMQDIVNNNRSVPITQPLKLTLSTRSVHAILIRGSAQVGIDTVQDPGNANFLIDGGGAIRIGKLAVDKFAVNLIGQGNFSIKGGTARSGDLSVTGNAVFDAPALSMRTLKITHNGNGSTTASVSESAEIFNSGSGNINVSGAGECLIRKAGSATINCLHVRNSN